MLGIETVSMARLFLPVSIVNGQAENMRTDSGDYLLDIQSDLPHLR